MKITSRVDYRNQRYYGTIRIIGEVNPYSDDKNYEARVLYTKVWGENKKKCEELVAYIVEQWQSSLRFTSLFYDVFKRTKRRNINAEKVINSYFQMCASKALVEPVRMPLISVFEQNTADMEIKIGKLVVNRIESLRKGVQAQTYRELHYFSLFGLGKDTMEEHIRPGYLEQAVFFGLLYQTPLRIREILELSRESLKGRTLYASSLKVRDQKMAYRLNRKLCRMIRALSRGRDKIFKLDLGYYVSYVPRKCGNSAHEFRQAYLMRKIWLDEEKHNRLLLY